jgi:hypothetical protein
MRSGWSAAWILLASSALPAAERPPADVIACMRDNLPAAVRVQTFELTSWDRAGGERVLRGRLFGTRENDRARVMARLEFPHDVAGTAFLLREASVKPELYLYLPSINRVKRLAGAAAGGKLWGTDFSYGEFQRVQQAFGGGTAVVEGQAQHDGRPVHVVALTAPATEENPYDSVRLLVDARSCVPLQAEFRRAEVVRKLLTVRADQLQQAGKHWYAAETELKDLQEGTRTRLRVLGLSAAPSLSAGYFHPQQFYSAR